MQIRPILSALRHHRLTVALIVLEIALAFAVLCNACFVVMGELHVMNVQSGVNEPSLAVLSIDNFDRNRIGDVNARVMTGLRRIDGLTSVDLIDGLPFVDAGGAPLSPHRGGELRGYLANFYFGDLDAPHALGLRLLSGHMPQDADLTPADADHQRALISQSLAQRLWPGQDPLGRLAWCCQGTGSFRVIGVVRHLVHAQPRDNASSDWSIFVPTQADSMKSGEYLLRASPRNIDAVLRKARAAMATLAPRATIDDAHTGTLEDLRARYFQSSRTTAGMLAGTIAALLLVTALGIVGLTGYWVQLRRKQIGIRRAVGATRGDILRHFQTENFLIVTGGVLLGVILAIGANMLLMQHAEVARLPWWYLPVGAVVLWGLGQLAVLGPALRAAHVPPVVATRSV